MTQDELDRITSLCGRIAKEQDPQKFTQLVEQLADLLPRSEEERRSRVS